MLFQSIFVAFFELWKWIIAMSAATGVISLILQLRKSIEESTTKRVLANFVSAISITIIVLAFLIGNTFSEVPELKGKTFAEAKEILRATGLKIALQVNETVKDESKAIVVYEPENVGLPVLKGTEIMVYVHEAFEDGSTLEHVVVPNVVGLEQEDAVALLHEQGLEFQVWWTEENSQNANQYFVLTQSIPGDVSVEKGTLVKLELSPRKE